jgi:hypothetical protein
MELHETVNMASKLWDYINEKKQDGALTNKLMTHLGLDNPYILKKRTYEEWTKTIDKFFIAQEIFSR